MTTQVAAPAAALALARSTAAVDLRDDIGTRAGLVRPLPRDTRITAATGGVDGIASRLGSGWTLVALTTGEVGWLRGRDVAAGPACAPAPPADARLWGLDPSQPSDVVAWVIRPSADGHGSTVALYAVTGCALGDELRRVEVPGEVRDLWMPRATVDAGPRLLVVVSASDALAADRTVRVFADGDAPVYQRDLPEGQITGPAARGPGGRRGYYPVAVTAPDGDAWLTWTGTTLAPTP